MSAYVLEPAGSAPDWLAAELPPGYQNRLAEIQRLTEELRAIESFGRLLWHVGSSLTGAAHDAFAALGFESELTAGPIALVTLGRGRRLFVQGSTARDVIHRRSPDLADAFRIVHELAGEHDRVVLVANTRPEIRPADRPDPLEPDALTLLRRLGVNLLPGPTLFALWMLSLENRERARALVERLHGQDGGIFLLPAAAVR